jgi:ribosomal protein L44E
MHGIHQVLLTREQRGRAHRLPGSQATRFLNSATDRIGKISPTNQRLWNIGMTAFLCALTGPEQYSATGTLRTESEVNRWTAQIRGEAAGRILLAQRRSRRVKSDAGGRVQPELRRRQSKKMGDRADRAMLRMRCRACRIAAGCSHFSDAESSTDFGQITTLGRSCVDD